MTQLETLKLEVDALAEKINSAMASSEDSVTSNTTTVERFCTGNFKRTYSSKGKRCKLKM
jgi:hypothetical protein